MTIKATATKLFNDKNFTVDNVVTSREGIKDEEKSSLGAVIKTINWAVTNKVKNQDEYIRKQVHELEEMMNSTYHKNSDVHDFQVQRKVEFIQNLQKTHDEIEEFKEVMYQIHKDLFGSEYEMPVPKSEQVVDTASTLEAKQLIAQFK